VVEVLPPPEILVIGEGAEPVRLADALGAAGGFKTTVLGPRRLPGRLSALERWPVIVLVDVPAAALAHEQRALLEAAVADTGQGLLMMAGRSSFALGGWRATPLEALAPVRLEPAPSGRRREVALLLMVDRSASMAGGDSRSRASKLDLAREAGLLAAEALSPQDRIGALAYDDEARWLSVLAPVGLPGERRDFRRSLAQITPGGGTRILAALELGLPALGAQEAATRHAVLLSDGRDDQLQEEPMAEAVRRARASGVTLSVIAIGLDADAAVLQRLARLGGGRYHAARDPGDLPRLTAEESQMVRAGAEREGNVRVRRAGAGGRHPVLSGVDLVALPALAGYQALLGRPDADVLLESEDGDPILGVWRYGRGQVAAWTADAGAAWASEWLESPEGIGAWGQILHQLAPAEAEARLTVEAEPDADGRSAVVTARLSGRDGRSQSLADVSLRFTDPTASDDPLVLPEVAPGVYRRVLSLGDPTDGPLLWRATVTALVDGPRPEGSAVQTEEEELRAPLRIARGHAAETLPHTDGEALLVEIARRSGGRVLDSLPEQWRSAPEPDRPLWPWLLGLVVLAWPLDLAFRLRRAPRGPRPAIRASSNPDSEGAQP
jgi:Mg-chelatase subunit ChlD